MANTGSIYQAVNIRGGIVGKLRAAFKFLQTIDDPAKSDVRYGINAFVIPQLESVSPTDIVEVLTRIPDLEQMFNEAYDPSIDVKALAALPAGTLGHEYARFLRLNSIDPLQTLLKPRQTLENPVVYAVSRAYKLHDIMHVVMGCDASVMGEVKIVAFSFGQGGAQTAAIALGALLMHLAIKAPDEFVVALSTAVAWYQKGLNSPPHVSFRFEDRWHEPVEHVKAALLAA